MPSGENALENSKVLNKLSACVSQLAGQKNEIMITHGNGPQVGWLALHKDGNLAFLSRKKETQIGSVMRKSPSGFDARTGRSAEAVTVIGLL